MSFDDNYGNRAFQPRQLRNHNQNNINRQPLQTRRYQEQIPTNTITDHSWYGVITECNFTEDESGFKAVVTVQQRHRETDEDGSNFTSTQKFLARGKVGEALRQSGAKEGDHLFVMKDQPAYDNPSNEEQGLRKLFKFRVKNKRSDYVEY